MASGLKCAGKKGGGGERKQRYSISGLNAEVGGGKVREKPIKFSVGQTCGRYVELLGGRTLGLAITPRSRGRARQMGSRFGRNK